MTTRGTQRLFDPRVILEQPEAMILLGGIAGLMMLTPVVFGVLQSQHVIAGDLKRELWQRWLGWLIVISALVLPIAAGAAYTVLAFTGLGLLCYREFARATGLFRHRLVSGVVVLGTVLIHFAALDHYYAFFVALFPLTVGAIAVAGILPDQPKGYLQRIALAIFAYCLFGVSLAHLSYFTNDWDYRGIMLWLLLAVSLNDIFAYCVGKTLGRRKFAPNTSPGKTWAGAIGAVVLTLMVATPLAVWVFEQQNDPIAAAWPTALFLALLIGVLGQAGDLLLSSVKRDLGIKDLGRVLPGHGGILDRFDSLILVAPAVFHSIGAVRGLGLGETPRLFTGGG